MLPSCGQEDVPEVEGFEEENHNNLESQESWRKEEQKSSGSATQAKKTEDRSKALAICKGNKINW